MPTQHNGEVATEAPETGREGRLAQPRAVVEGVLGSAGRLARAPQDILRAQYELTRSFVTSSVVVDVVVNVDVASRQARREA